MAIIKTVCINTSRGSTGAFVTVDAAGGRVGSWLNMEHVGASPCGNSTLWSTGQRQGMAYKADTLVDGGCCQIETSSWDVHGCGATEEMYGVLRMEEVNI
jgi:hypothetical protein